MSISKYILHKLGGCRRHRIILQTLIGSRKHQQVHTKGLSTNAYVLQRRSNWGVVYNHTIHRLYV